MTLASGCTNSDADLADPIAVESAVDVVRSGQPVLRVGAVIDQNSPSRERDNRIIERFRDATEQIDGAYALQLEVTPIDEPADIPGALDVLTELGVTVLLTTCDTTSVPLIAEAAADRSLFTVTGCAAMPQPVIDRSPLFADLAHLGHVDEAMAIWARQEGHETAAVVSSDLLKDVEDICVGFTESFERRGGTVDEAVSFTGVLDPVEDVVGGVGEQLAEADVLAVCALPGTVGPLVDALRTAGHDQPLILPWFADEENWSADTTELHLMAPASRHGDDPVDVVDTFVDGESAADALVLDTVAMLMLAADAADSVGSQRLNDAVIDQEFDAPSGVLLVDPDTRQTAGRTYRLITVDDGDASFSRSIATD